MVASPIAAGASFLDAGFLGAGAHGWDSDGGWSEKDLGKGTEVNLESGHGKSEKGSRCRGVVGFNSRGFHRTEGSIGWNSVPRLSQSHDVPNRISRP